MMSEKHTSSEKYSSGILNDYQDKKCLQVNFTTGKNLLFWLYVIGVIALIIAEKQNAQQNKDKAAVKVKELKFWTINAQTETGTIELVHAFLKKIGYKNRTYCEKAKCASDWNLMWYHGPWSIANQARYIKFLKPHQMINHFPGKWFLANELQLATSSQKYIPRAFKLPNDWKNFQKYVEKHNDSWFLENDPQKAAVLLKNATEILSSNRTKILREYIQNPFLVNGHKFDFGVYVLVTSVNPLRAYWYKGDVLFRYCPSKYHPFDQKDVDKFVLGDNHLGTWNLSALAQPFFTFKAGMKDSFDFYARFEGKNPITMWEEVRKVIADVLLLKENHIVQALKKYNSTNNYFQLMRFDFTLDETFKVYLQRVDESPDLDAKNHPSKQMLFEHLLYNLFYLVGLSSPLKRYQPVKPTDSPSAADMVSADKNIAVWGVECNELCSNDCFNDICQLCKLCRSKKVKKILLQAHREHIHRGDFGRIFPPALKPNTSPKELELSHMSPANKLHYLYYQGKCNMDITWCN